MDAMGSVVLWTEVLAWNDIINTQQAIYTAVTRTRPIEAPWCSHDLKLKLPSRRLILNCILTVMAADLIKI